jgi:hypothetical protein
LGEIAIAVSDFGSTVSVALPVTPLSVAVMVLEPAATAVALPVVFTVATAGEEEVHVTVEFTFAVDLSL